MHLALALCDYTYVVVEGRVFLEGPAQKIAQNDEVRTAYLGV